MSTWNRILDEIESNNNLHNSHIISNLDNIRRKYLTDLYNITKRNVILYYSGWLQQRGVPGTEINDEDINSIVSVMDELPAADGLDIILHTPGGIISSTERLVEILRTVFGHNIRAFIPQIAMSGGTLIAFACKEIYMAKFASIGPIDPQIFIPNVGYVSAISLIEEFDRAFTEIKNDNDKILIWNPILDKYNPSTIINCGKAIELTKNLSVDYLMSGVLSDEDEDISATKSEKITKELIENVKSHDTHISPYYCKNQLSLDIKILEDEPDMFNTIMAIHNSCIHGLSKTDAIKIIENHNGQTYVQFAPKLSKNS